MKYQGGTCTWEDIVNNPTSTYRHNFFIQRQALQILQPINNNGELQCYNEEEERTIYPRLDYSKGFPEWWHLAHTDIMVKSEHFQETKQYDAEVHLSHFYSTNFPNNRVSATMFSITGAGGGWWW